MTLLYSIFINIKKKKINFTTCKHNYLSKHTVTWTLNSNQTYTSSQHRQINLKALWTCVMQTPQWTDPALSCQLTCLYASSRKLFHMERTPAVVNMRCHSPGEPEQLRSDTTRLTSTIESYSTKNRQLEKKPGNICKVTRRSTLSMPISRWYITGG